MNAVHKLNQVPQGKMIVLHPESIPKQKEKYQDKKVHTPVQPLKTDEEIANAKNYFLNRPERYKGQNIRDWCIFVLGINIARRAGDLLHLRIHNVLDENMNIKKHITISEQKTGKTAQLVITPTVENALSLYLQSLDDIDLDGYLFPSRTKKCKHNPDGKQKAMTVTNFYLKLQDMKDELELNRSIGTHSLRKSWGYATLRNNKDDAHIVAKISKAYNHSKIETTFRYLGIEQEEIDETFMNNQL